MPTSVAPCRFWHACDVSALYGVWYVCVYVACGPGLGGIPPPLAFVLGVLWFIFSNLLHSAFVSAGVEPMFLLGL